MTASSSEAHALPLLPVPDIPSTAHRSAGSVAFTSGHHFTLAGHDDPRMLAECATTPLSVILQVTKRCDFGCVFCSETLQMGDPTLMCATVGQHVIDIPPNMTTAGRVRWIADQVTKLSINTGD